MSNKKTCCICYNKNTNDNLKCKTCKNCVCDVCYANIIYNNIEFSLSYNKMKRYINVHFVIMKIYLVQLLIIIIQMII